MDNKNNSMPGWDDFFSGNKKEIDPDPSCSTSL